MAKSIKFRSFNDGGNTVTFSFIRFRKELRDWQEKQKEETGNKPTLDDVYNIIAERVHVSPEAVRNWDRGQNGVNDFTMVRNIANILDIDYKNLIVSSTDTNDNAKLNPNFDPVSNNEKDLIIQLYQLFTDYIYWFCGTNNDKYAYHVLEDPWAEQDEYIMKLYHFLDQIALSISQDTYRKLRMTITELYVLSGHWRDATFLIPDFWTTINPNLDTSIFRYIYYGVDDIETYIEDNESQEIDELFHMMLEDIPDVVDVWYGMKFPTLIEMRGTLPPEKMPSRIKNGFYSMWFGGYPEVYEIIVRELASTLTDVMRARFPQYFESDTNN